MMKKLALCGVLWVSLSGCVQPNYTAQPVYRSGYAYNQIAPEPYYYSRPAPRPYYYQPAPHTYYAPPQGYHGKGHGHHGRQHGYYVQEARPLNKGEHFYNEHGQYCKLTHGKNIICK